MKKIVICLVDSIKNQHEFEKFLNTNDDTEIHIVNGLNENNIKPHDIYFIIEDMLNISPKNAEIHFLSDTWIFIKLIYRLYHDTFKSFTYYYEDMHEYNVKLDEIYVDMLVKTMEKQEGLYKSIFVNEDGKKYLESINDNLELVKVNVVDSIDASIYYNNYFDCCETRIKYYKLEDKYYVFQPIGDKSNIIFDHNCDDRNIKYENTIFMYNGIDKDCISSYIYNINENYDYFIDNLDEIYSYFKCVNINREFYYKERFLTIFMESLSFNVNEKCKIFIYSYLNSLLCKPLYINKILKIAISNDSFNSNNEYFIYYQCVRHLFTNLNSGNAETGELLRNLYEKSLSGFLKEIPRELKFIDKQKRNKDLVFVFTTQFLNLTHGPTKTTLDRAYSLIKSLNKKVVIINTKEILSINGVIPYFNISQGNVMSEHQNKDIVEYKDIKIPFYQAQTNMPDISEIAEIVNIVEKYKPYFILSIGGASIAADICNKIVPVITQATVMGLPMCKSTFILPGKKLSLEEKSVLTKLNVDEDRVIEGVFTFDFKAQKNLYERKNFNLPENKFLILIVGARLDYEVTKEFLDSLKRTFDHGTYLVFAGCFDKYNTLIKDDTELRVNSSYLGFQQDMLAIAGICDLYVNPQRAGGQTSAAEAMYKGLPVVTLSFGDVSICTQKEFWVRNYDEMTEKIIKYVKDKEYYEIMSKKAKERVKILLDTNSEMKRILEIIEKNKFFK